MEKAKAIKESSPKERIREFLSALNVKHAEAEKMCGFGRGYLGTGGEITTDKLRSLKQQFPAINIEYIVTGNPIDEYRLETSEDQISLLRQINRTIEKLKEKNNAMIGTLKREVKQMKS